MFRKFLVPTDGSDLSQRAIMVAVAFAGEVGARISFVHVKPDYEASLYGESALMEVAAPELLYDMTQRRAQEILGQAVALAQAAGVACEAFAVSSDKPYAAIIATAEREACDLILMASHGRGGMSGVLLGSVTQKVLTHCKLPVLVYR